MAATTQLHIVKYANDGTTILAEKTLTYQEMRDTLPVQGDGTTHYYHQGPVFIDGPDETTEQALRWNPQENTNINDVGIKGMGALKGTNVKDLCDLVGGMSPGDEVKILAVDGWYKWFAYKNVYRYSSREGPMVIAWYNGAETPGSWEGQGVGYVPDYYVGMRLVWFADTSTNPWHIHAFGNYDWHQAADQKYWYYYEADGEKYPTTTGLSGKCISDIKIYSSLPPQSSISGSVGWGGGISTIAGAAPADDASLYGYKGSKLSTYASGTLNGSIRLLYDPNSTPVVVNNRIQDYSIPLDLPPHSNLTLARLYVYVSRSHGIQAGQGGVVPSLYTRFNQKLLRAEKVYIDTDGDEHRNVSATYAYDVLQDLQGNGTYTVSLRNLDYDQYVFSVEGVMLLVAYEQEQGQPSQYWIGEGCDIIFSDPKKGIFPKDAATSMTFGGTVNFSKTISADLMVIATNIDTSNTTEHSVKFNNGTWNNPFDNQPGAQILRIPVTPWLNQSGSAAFVESTIRNLDADYLVNRNAILVIGQNQSVGADTESNRTILSPDQSVFVNSSPLLNTTPLSNNTSTCTLSLHSDPEGALIFVDGTYLGKTTPLTLKMNSSDERRIRLELDGYVPAERNLGITNDTTVCEHLYTGVYSTKWRSDELVPEREITHNGGLYINSRPRPAIISLDGIQMSQRTPVVLAGLKEGTYTVRLSFQQTDPFIRENAEIQFEDQEVYVYPYCIVPVDVTASTSPLQEIIIDSHDLRGEQFTVNGHVNQKIIPDKINAPRFDSFITVFQNLSYVSYTLPSLLNEDHYLIIQPRQHFDLNVFVDSRPRGAEVFIDGFRTGLSTPYSFTNISDGPHRIMVSKPGYIPQEHSINLLYTLVPVSTTNVSFILEEYPSGFLRVASDPPGAAITLDGRDTGEVTPLMLPSVPTGLHSVVVSGNNISKKFPDITVNAVELTNISVDLQEIQE
ncbi:MAG: PEGA domain-containing protein [Methanoregula sp.]|nr:PEGA domain-containing protein [Methanoregula sp.]